MYYKLLSTQLVFRLGSVVYKAADAVHLAWLDGYRLQNGDEARLKPLPDCDKLTSKEAAELKLKALEENYVNYDNPLQITESNGKFQIVQNIAVHPDQLHPSLHYKLSGAAAADYVQLIQQGPERFNTIEGVQSVLKDVHNVWKGLNKWEVAMLQIAVQKPKPDIKKVARLALFQREFLELPPNEQLKDIAVIVPILKTAFPEIGLETLNKYKEGIEFEIKLQASV